MKIDFLIPIGLISPKVAMAMIGNPCNCSLPHTQLKDLHDRFLTPFSYDNYHSFYPKHVIIMSATS